MNHITIEGGLTRDSELKYLQSGNAVLNFSVACNDGSGEYKKTTFFDCAIFGKFAESMAQYLVKGAKVVLFGHMETRKYQAKDNTERTAWSVKVDELRLVGGRKTDQEAPPADGGYDPGEPPPVQEVEDPFL